MNIKRQFASLKTFNHIFVESDINCRFQTLTLQYETENGAIDSLYSYY